MRLEVQREIEELWHIEDERIKRLWLGTEIGITSSPGRPDGPATILKIAYAFFELIDEKADNLHNGVRQIYKIHNERPSEEDRQTLLTRMEKSLREDFEYARERIEGTSTRMLYPFPVSDPDTSNAEFRRTNKIRSFRLMLMEMSHAEKHDAPAAGTPIITIHGSNFGQIGDQNEQRIRERNAGAPAANPEPPPKPNVILSGVGKIIVAVIGGLVVTYIAWKLGWKK